MFSLFPKYRSCPTQFEIIWKTCIKSIETTCRRIRNQDKPTKRTLTPLKDMHVCTEVFFFRDFCVYSLMTVLATTVQAVIYIS